MQTNIFKTKQYIGVVFFIVLALTLTGCKKEQEDDLFMKKWYAMAEQSMGHSPTATEREVPVGLYAEDMVIEPERKLPSVQISKFDMRGANLVAVLRTLGKVANQSIMISPNVQGTINLTVERLPWNRVFKGIIKTHGLAYEWEGNILRVMTLADMEASLKMEDIRYRKPLVTTAIKINYADATMLRDDIEQLLTKGADGQVRGSVQVIEHTNSLVISAVEKDIRRFTELINKLDKPIPQIRLKAYIVEASTSVARDLGIQWGGSYKDTSSGGDQVSIFPGGTSAGPTLNDGLKGVSDNGFGINFPGSTVGTTGEGAALGLIFQSLKGNTLEVQLHALASEGRLNILSSPSITTLDNKTAFTENGEEVPFVTLDEAGNREVEWKEALLRLEITPHVIDGINLRMDIEVKKDEVDFTRSVQGNPIIIKKTTQTSLVARDGETIVISGLTRRKLSTGDSGVPGLKDIPVAGWLFKSDSKSETKDEVLIFITPYILAEWKPGERQKTLEEIEQELQEQMMLEENKEEYSEQTQADELGGSEAVVHEEMVN